MLSHLGSAPQLLERPQGVRPICEDQAALAGRFSPSNQPPLLRADPLRTRGDSYPVIRLRPFEHPLLWDAVGMRKAAGGKPGRGTLDEAGRSYLRSWNHPAHGGRDQRRTGGLYLGRGGACGLDFRVLSGHVRVRRRRLEGLSVERHALLTGAGRLGPGGDQPERRHDGGMHLL
jgi:hypothetical protein